MTRLPDALTLNCTLPDTGLHETASAILAALKRSGLPQPSAWASPADSADTPGIPDVTNLTTGAETVTEMRIEFAEGGTGVLWPACDTPGWNFRLSMYRIPDPDACVSLMAALAAFCRALLDERMLVGAELARIGIGLNCLPIVPIAGLSPLLVTTEEAISGEYLDVTAFLSCWPVREQRGDRLLLLRGMECADGADYLAAIQEGQWALARGARPARTRYFDPRPLADEEPVFKAGEPRLVPVGHLQQGNVVEFAAAVGEMEHIRGWEIFQLRALLSVRSLPDGRRVEAIHVVFLTRDMAMRERRPLLDIGAKVCFQVADRTEELMS